MSPLHIYTSFFVHLCFLQLHHGPLSLAGTPWVKRPQRHPGQSAPGKCGELCGARSSSADVCGCNPVEPLRTKGVVVSWEDLVNLFNGLPLVKHFRNDGLYMLHEFLNHQLWHTHASFLCYIALISG